MLGEHAIQVELLEDDFREIKTLLRAGTDADHELEALLHEAIGQYRQDEAAWRDVEHRHDMEAERTKLELKRRETTALLMSMRSRTIRSEMQMHELRETVLGLQERHAEQRRRAEVLRQSIGRLRQRTAQLEALLHMPAQDDVPARPSALRDMIAHLWKRNG